MTARDIITHDPGILGGTPVFAGTRVPVDTLTAHLRAGDSLEIFLQDFPSVSREQAQTFLDLAGDALIQEVAHAGAA